MLDMFLYYESATHLDVSSNSGMGFSGWLSLSHLLKQVESEYFHTAYIIPLPNGARVFQLEYIICPFFVFY